MGTLLDDRPTTVNITFSGICTRSRVTRARVLPLGLVPPVLFSDCFIRACIARDGGHYLKVVILDDFLDHLDTSQVAQHVSNAMCINLQ